MRGGKRVKGRKPLREFEGRALKVFRGEKMFDVLCFSWIAFCFLLSFFGGVPLAAGLTLCADFFLIFTTHYAIGLAFFILAQSAYLQSLRHKPFRWQYFAALPLAFLLPLPALGGGYALLFARHFYFAMKKARAYKNAPAMLYVLALVLFAACDLTVAWGYFARPAPVLIWLFYAPSQFLLALTAKPWQPPRRFFHSRRGTKALPSHRADP